MNSHWTLATLLGCSLLVGCGDRAANDAGNLNETPAPAEETTGADQENPPAATAEAPPAANPPSTSTATRPATRPAAPAARAPEASAPAREPAAPPPPAFREVTVPANTALPLELLTSLSTETAKVETPVRARLRNAVLIDGVTAIPAGATLVGEVTEVVRAGRVQGRSRLAFRFNEVQMNGMTEPLRTNPIVFEGEATKGEDATKIGVGAGIGAAIGGLLGGGDGAAKGAAIGGAAGTGAVLATRGRDVELATGADISATLATPFEIQVPAR